MSIREKFSTRNGDPEQPILVRLNVTARRLAGKLACRWGSFRDQTQDRDQNNTRQMHEMIKITLNNLTCTPPNPTDAVPKSRFTAFQNDARATRFPKQRICMSEVYLLMTVEAVLRTRESSSRRAWKQVP